MRTIKRILWRFNPFKSRKRGWITSKMYHTFVTYDSFQDQMSSMRKDIRELKGLVNQLAAKSKLKHLNGVLMSEKEYDEADKAIGNYYGIR